MQTITVRTNKNAEFVPISHLVEEVVRRSGVKAGACIITTDHTTCGLTINEGADPDVVYDMLYLLDKLVPWNDPNYRHYEGNTAAHLKTSLMGTSLHVIISDGQIRLGRWQEIYLCEFDGPRTRQVHVQVVLAAEEKDLA